MSVNFLELTCSTYYEKGQKKSFEAPFFQILRSFASAKERELTGYRTVKNILKNNGKTKASKMLRNHRKTCFITNSFTTSEKNSTSNLDVSLFIVFALENKYKNNTLSIKSINTKYSFDRPEFTRQIAKLQNLKFACYKFSDKEFYDDMPVFDYVYQKGSIIEFSFSDFFNELVLAGGRTFRLPATILTSLRNERNAIYSLGQIYISLFYSVQNYISKKESLQLSITFSLKDYYDFCGINFKEIRFDKLYDCTVETLLSLKASFEILNIFFDNKNLPLSKQAFNRKEYFDRKSQLINSEVKIVFEQKDLYE